MWGDILWWCRFSNNLSHTSKRYLRAFPDQYYEFKIFNKWYAEAINRSPFGLKGLSFNEKPTSPVRVLWSSGSSTRKAGRTSKVQRTKGFAFIVGFTWNTCNVKLNWIFKWLLNCTKWILKSHQFHSVYGRVLTGGWNNLRKY